MIRRGVAIATVAALVLAVVPASIAAASSSSPSPDDHLFSVPSGAMIPTIDVGDLIVVDEKPRDFEPLRTGEVIVFHAPAAAAVCGSPQTILVKRVIGLPGETIQSRGNNVYLDGRLFAEPWLPSGSLLGKTIPLQRIPADRYFVLGDNRSISCDSRYWGTVPASSVIGKVVLACSPNSAKVCKAIS